MDCPELGLKDNSKQKKECLKTKCGVLISCRGLIIIIFCFVCVRYDMELNR